LEAEEAQGDEEANRRCGIHDSRADNSMYIVEQRIQEIELRKEVQEVKLCREIEVILLSMDKVM
jgi:hypothetical protein